MHKKTAPPSLCHTRLSRMCVVYGQKIDVLESAVTVATTPPYNRLARQTAGRWGNEETARVYSCLFLCEVTSKRRGQRERLTTTKAMLSRGASHVFGNTGIAMFASTIH
mmetsp:Transcript_4366/g.11497  ORF Transcript_4366/g.11497 Transcript_4366/m.11497 type:complete len:109 (+) Transcript_4366:1144-1470(+)